MGSIIIRRAKKIVILPMFRSGRPLSETRQRDENRYLQLLHLALSEHTFYYSASYDVTLTQQKLAMLSSRLMAESVWMRSDERFFWNRNAVADLIACEATQWVTPFMSAYIEVRSECEIEGDKFTLLFISRRSRHRQGCRFIKRGIDEEGHVANFVETEQIIIYPDGRLSSFVQVRGSIPLKWASPVTLKYEPAVLISANKKHSYSLAEKHVKDLVAHYNDEIGNAEVIFVNLIDNKKDQGALGVEFKDVITNVQLAVQHPLQYVWFDYHHECKQKGKEKNLVKLIAKIDKYFKTQKFFSKSAAGIVLSWQQGVFRTNCMDNLDRTNVVQSIIARRSLFIQLTKNSLYQENLENSIESPYKKFEKLFKSVWVNNADAISFGYAGTGALKTDVVKNGKRSIKGMFNDGKNSIMRYYINNFTDGAKQDAIDLLLCHYHPDPLSPSPFVPRYAQESLSDSLTKAFVLLVILFSILLVLSSMTNPFVHFFANWLNSTEYNPQQCSPGSYFCVNLSPYHMRTLKTHISNLFASAMVTLLVLMYLMYKVVKKGSKMGQNIVVLPQLLPEPLP